MYYTLHRLLICLIMICSLLGCSLVSQTKALPPSPSADLSSLVTPTSLTSTATRTTSPTLSPTETAKPTRTATSTPGATRTGAPTWTHFPTYTPSPTASPTLTPFIEPPPSPEGLPHPPLGYRWTSWSFRQSALDGELLFQDRGQLVALSATDGQLYWWYGLPEGKTIDAMVTTKESVFMLTYQPLEANTRQLGVVALSKDGQLRWQREFPAEESYGAVGQKIYASKETVYVSDSSTDTIFALNTIDGTIRWQKSGECYHLGLAVEGALFALCEKYLLKFDEATGEIMMSLPTKSLIKDIAYNEGFIVTMSLVQLDSLNNGYVSYTLLDVWQDSFSHRVLWKINVPGRAAGLWADETTLAYRAGNTVRRVRLEDGDLLWETRLPEERGTNLVRVGEVLLVGSMAGYLHALDWESGFHLWSQNLWTSLKPHSLHITVLGASEEAIFLKLGYEDFVALTTEEQDAGASVVSTWPTATPTPTFTPQPISILPLPSISTPAADWTAPPLSEMPTNSHEEELIEAHLRVLSDFLNTMPDNIEEGVAQYTSWAWPDSERKIPFWAHAADLDSDGAVEWLISIVQPNTKCEPTSCPNLVTIFEYQNKQLVRKHLIRKKIEGLSHPQLVTIEDLNNDNQMELVLSTSQCGAHTCFTDLHIGHWDGQQWHDLGSMNQSYSEISILDQDSDGSKEIVMYGGLIASAGAGMQRQRTEIYGWKEGRYQLVAKIPDFEPDNIYFLMLDAHAALMNEDWDKALELAMMVVTQANAISKEGYRFSDWQRTRIVSYAAILAMLVHAQQNEVGAMEALLREVETRYDQFENPYVEAAQRLWYTYRDTQDPLLACQAVERTAREQQELAEFLLSYGYATERLPIKQICPFDD